MRIVRSNFINNINFPVYESFFRSFCKKKYIESEFLLRADFKSFNEGVGFWFDNVENKPLTQLIHLYIGRGKVNHIITFSEFIYFIRELQLRKQHRNLVIFKFLSEG